MAKYMTGFCQLGLHEGTSPTSGKGKPMKVCVAWQECKCSCHAGLTKMCTDNDIPRTEYQNPKYVPYDSGIFEFMESYRGALQADLLPGTTQLSRIVEERPFEAAGVAEPTSLRVSGRTFEPNLRGRGSGQLEDQVRQVINRALLGEFDEVCTPKFVASQIDPDNPPSVGAVGAVFDRWEKIGFAVILKGPVRFQTLTADGLLKGLEFLKEKHKRENKRPLRSAIRR